MVLRHVVGLLLLLSVLRVQFVKAVSWKDAGEVNWDEWCDYSGNDIGKERSTGEECGGRCVRQRDCTHFVWTDWEGGTCWKKGGQGNWDQEAYLKSNGYSVCGFVKARNGGGGGGGGINYFGVAFSPYVKNPPFPNWDTYTLDEIKQMLRIILTKHNSVSTYSMGVADYNNGKSWDKCDSTALVARAAAQINREKGAVVLSVSQGIYQNTDGSLQQREINNAFSAAADANGIFPGTVWGLTFTNEYVTDGSNGPKVLAMIQQNRDRARGMGLKVGTRVHTCGEIWGGNNQRILQQIAQASDFIMCNFYPGEGANNPANEVEGISNAYFSARDGFWRSNSNLEVMIGETGWASQGPTFNHAVNTIENERKFWEGMKSWSSSRQVKVQMFEAFDEPWKTGEEGEKHFGWWYRPNNGEARYIEKATGQVYQ